MVTELQRIRKAAGVTQVEAAVRAGVSPLTARNFERFGEAAVEDEAKCASLVAVFAAFKVEAEQRGRSAA